MERAYFDARSYGGSRFPIVEMVIPSTLDDSLAPPGQHVASLFCQHVAPTLPDGASWDTHRDTVADLKGGSARAPDHEPARPRAHLRAGGRRHLPRCAQPRSAVFRPADARLRQLPRAARRTLHVRRGHPSRRRRNGGTGPQRGARGARRLPPRAAAPAGGVSAPRRAPRFKRRLPAERRLALIEATIECLKRFGHDGLSIRTISAQAPVSVGLINHHFPNKNELVAAAYRHFNAQLVGGMQAAVAQAPESPPARMRAFLQASFAAPNLDADTLAVWVVFWGMYRHSRSIQRVQHETHQDYVRLVRGLVAELLAEAGAGKRRRVRRGVPAAAGELRRAAIGLTALLDGLWLQWCLQPSAFRPDEAVRMCEAWIASLCERISGEARD